MRKKASPFQRLSDLLVDDGCVALGIAIEFLLVRKSAT